jgi:hypothetical protein
LFADPDWSLDVASEKSNAQNFRSANEVGFVWQKKYFQFVFFKYFSANEQQGMKYLPSRFISQMAIAKSTYLLFFFFFFFFF